VFWSGSCARPSRDGERVAGRLRRRGAGQSGSGEQQQRRNAGGRQAAHRPFIATTKRRLRTKEVKQIKKKLIQLILLCGPPLVLGQVVRSVCTALGVKNVHCGMNAFSLNSSENKKKQTKSVKYLGIIIDQATERHDNQSVGEHVVNETTTF
jgi:hypothetical protein